MSKINYYKLSEASSIFYDPKNRLKITKGIPAKASDLTKKTKDAIRSGHIIVISESEYNTMMDKLPELTKKAALKEQSTVVGTKKKEEIKKPVVVEEEDKDEEESDQDDNDQDEEEREGLMERLKDLDLSKKEYSRVSKFSDADLKEYLEDNE